MKRWGGVVAIALGMGCASSVSQEKLQLASDSIRSAEMAGARQHPQSAEQLRLAKTALDQAASAEPDEANRMLERAYADAELARAQARRDQARGQVETTNARMRALSAER